MGYNQQNRSIRKPYSKLTAQIARNTVKKYIVAIKSNGARAADTLIDQFIGANNGAKSNTSILTDKYFPLIEQNRAKWRNFIIELAGSFDADSLSTVGVGIVYGGIMSSSVGDSGWASEIILDSKKDVLTADQVKKAADLISSGRNRGNMIWLIKGKGTYSQEMLRIYRYNPECIFFLAESSDNSVKISDNASKHELLATKNIVFVLWGREQSDFSAIDEAGIPYIIDPSLKAAPTLPNDSKTSPKKEYEKDLFRFLEAPSFPLTIYRLTEVADHIENLLSEGKSRQIPRHKI